MPENIDYKDTTEEFKTRLRADLEAPDRETIDHLLNAIVIFINKGYEEMDLLRERYPDLICPWCGGLHFSQKCRDKREQFIKEQPPRDLDFDPYAIFYNAGSLELRIKLQALSYGELEYIRKRFTTAPPAQEFNLLIDLIVKDVKDRCHQGAAFGDYKLPD